jgi:response regulator RpfG family c-di-GMP phosphodiesterase
MKNVTNVLLVDDELWLPTRRFEQVFERAGFNLMLAEGIDELLEKLPSADALIVDARMSYSKFDGVDTVVGLVESNRLPSRVPIIFTSILSESVALPNSKLAILRDKRRYLWIKKPFDLHYLLLKVREELKRTARSW